MKKSKSLMIQMSVAIVVITTVILTVFGYTRYLQNLKIQNEQLENSLIQIIERLSLGLSSPFFAFDDGGLKAIILSEMKNKSVNGIFVFGQSEDKAKYGYIRAGDIIESTKKVKLRENDITETRTIEHKNLVLGNVHVIMSKDIIKERIKRMLISDFFQMLLLDFILVFITIFFLKIKFIRPISELTIISSKIASGKLDQPITVRTDDEIGILTHSFLLMQKSINEMITSLNNEIQERKQAEQALSNETQLSNEYINSLPGLFYVIDEQRLVRWNKEIEIVTGCNTVELGSVNTFDICTPEDREKIIEAQLRVFRDGSAAVEARILTKFGREIPYYFTGKLKELNGKKHLVGMGIDITKYKQAVEERRGLESKLQQAQKMEAIGTLAGGIAHDFNNILGAILGYAELAQLNTSDNPKVQKYIDQLCMASERAKALVLQILAFSRQSKSEKIPVDIGLVIKEALKLLRASIPTTIEIRQNVKSNICTVEADQTQIHQIVMNLCTNAFHAMEKEGGQLDVDLIPVTISADDCQVYEDIKPGRYIKLIVVDTGHGMDADTISRIFEPYFTTKEVGEGTGMGLATVHGLVKNHAGDIKVYSEPGGGTSFHILFPVIENDTERIIETSIPLPKGHEQILFVDDEKFLVDIGKESLVSLGYKVETRTSSYDALEAFYNQPDKYDMVITDMTMPKMTGEKLAEEIKKIRPDIPIILCTGYSKSITPENVRDMGISSILMKPLTMHELANTVRSVLDEK